MTHGLTEDPACSLGPPRAGYFVGIPGGVLTKSTWVDFSSVTTLDSGDLAAHVHSGRKTLTSLALSTKTFCAVLRCVLQCEDITLRESRWIADAVANLNCA